MNHTNQIKDVTSNKPAIKPTGSSLMCSLMFAMISLTSTLAMAQNELRPPKTSDTPSGPKYIIYLVAILLAGLVVVAATLKAKRSHQD